MVRVPPAHEGVLDRAAAFSALGDPIRLRVLDLLRGGEVCVCDLQEAIAVSPSLLSYHLRVLKEAHLVESTRHQRRVLYRLSRETLRSLCTSMKSEECAGLDGEADGASTAGSVVSRRAPPVVSFVAKSNSGKTTLLERLIPELKRRGTRVGVLKHHSHISSFDVPGKDTYRLAAAGADIVVGASPVQIAEFKPERGSADLDPVIARSMPDVDLVLIEGYKRGPYPKIEVHRSARSQELICRPDDLLAIVSDREWPLPVPQFGLDDVPGVAGFLAGDRSGPLVGTGSQPASF